MTNVLNGCTYSKQSLLASVLLSGTVAVLCANPAHAAGLNSFTEGFEDINTLAGNGWAFQNNSNPAPLTTTATANWFQGNSTFTGFFAQAGSANSYIFVNAYENFSSTAGLSGYVSNWLLTPELDFSQGGSLQFYTRTVLGNSRPNLLEVRQSTSGTSTNVGTTETSFGDFINLVLLVGSPTDNTVYPGGIDSTNRWGVFTLTLAPSVGSGRIGFRYLAPEGGDAGIQGLPTGIDTVSYIAVPEPSTVLGSLLLGSLGLGYRFRSNLKPKKTRP